MDPQSQALVAIHPQGRNVLLGHKLRQLIPGGGVRWCWPIRFDQAANGYIVQLEDYSEYPHPVPLNYLGVGLGERDATDPLILLLQSKGQNVAPFLSRQAPVPPPIQVTAAMAATPGFGFQTPLPGFGADPAEQTQAFQNAVMNLVQQGSLNDLMDSIILEYGTGVAFRAWRSKAKYLMAIYREGDRQKAHLKAAIFFLATRLNFVSADLEYLSDAYIAEMNAAIQRAGPPASWNMSTVSGLEDLAREKYFDYRSKADTAVSKGHARPMYDPTHPNR
jgi:hypothetical protein